MSAPLGSLQHAIMKALSTTAGAGGDFLPTPLATDFIKWIRDRNFCRQLFRVVTMPNKTFDWPKILSAAKVYLESEGGTATQTNITTGTVRLTAKKLMSQILATEELYEDANQDFDMIIRDHFAAAVAEAEEQSMILGDTTHTATSVSEAVATEADWFTKDNRLSWDGLLTLGGRIASAAPRVNGGSAAMSTAIARQMMYNLGKYGRVMQDLVLFVNPWSANELLDDAKLVTIDKYGQNATIVTGEFGKLYGKARVINSAFVTDGYAVMTHRSNPVIGDRRKIKIKDEEVIQSDQRRTVVSVRMDFKVEHHEAICQAYSLNLPSDAS